MAERYALETPLHLAPAVGEPVTPELLNTLSTFEFFAASICGQPPERLRLGDLVGALAHPERRQGDPHPRTRASDFRPIP